MHALRLILLGGSPVAVLSALCLTLTLPSLAQAEEKQQCPNAASRQGPSAALPECRAYEQVTPVNKGDALDLFQWRTFGGTAGAEPVENERASVAEDGGALLLETLATLSSGSAVSPASYIFSRGPGGWVMTPLVSPVPQTQVTSPEVFDSVDLSTVGFLDKAGSLADLEAGDPSALNDSLVVGPVGGPYATTYSLSGAEAYEGYGANMVGGSEDLSEVLLESREHGLIPGGVAEGQVKGSNAVYEWVDGALQLVNVQSDGSLVSPCGARLGQGGSAGGGAARSAVSSDGSKVFFTAPDPEGGCWNPSASPQENPPEVYMREREADGSQRTVDISVPEPEMVGVDPNGLQPAAFVGASTDGAKVFFVTKTQLTKNAKGHEPELYEYETKTSKLTLVSTSEAEPEGNVDFVGAISSDGQAVYFTAFSDLAPGAEKELTPGKPFSPVNLYRYDGESPEGHRLTFVTKIDAGDYPLTTHGVKGNENWATNPGAFGGPRAGRAKSVGLHSGAEWYTTGNGGFLVFGSYRPITGFDNNHTPESLSCQNLLEEETQPIESCMELFRYDAATGSVACVSCAGGAPVDNATFARDASGLNSAGSPRPISEDGRVVFFDSEDVLVPQATPGRVHVYESHAGTISLVSAPGDPGNAFFLGTSADGKNVFFSTHAQLAPSDTDQATDIYDARVDGGFEGVAPPVCTGTGCQGVPAAAPTFATPASATFEGAGNFPPPIKPAPKPKPRPKAKKCRRGQVRKHGRCVKPSKSAKGRG